MEVWAFSFSCAFYLSIFNLTKKKKKVREGKKEGTFWTTMASLSISASLQAACCANSRHLDKGQQQLQGKTSRPLGTKQVSSIVTVNVEGKKGLDVVEHQQKEEYYVSPNEVKPKDGDDELKRKYLESESDVLKFVDDRWKKGTWDLNMFVKNGRLNWDAVIVAEARRRKFLEMYPESATNEEPVVFRSSIIPWWAWLTRSYLPEAELLNGRAAMVGFFMGYVVDALTGLDVVGQSGNFICKAGVFVTVIGIILFRRSDDFRNLKNLADEATLYDRQWQASWNHKQNESTSASELK